MKRVLVAVALGIAAFLGAVTVKQTIPLSYEEVPIYQGSSDFVASLQKHSSLTAEQAATKYLYHNTDYAEEIPEHIKVKSKVLSDGVVRVTVHDSNCMDDSIYESIERIYMRRDATGAWRPIKLEYSQKGRGRFGWTTSPTS
jgi:hypothetical protein